MNTVKLIAEIGWIGVLLILVGVGCSGIKDGPDWTKSRKIAGKEQGLSHVSGMIVSDKFAYVAMGGTIADQNEGKSGVRKINLASGEVSVIDDGTKNIPQSELGGMAADADYFYWNASGSIWRAAKNGGKPENIISENAGIGLDIALDDKNIFWANHGYYSPGKPNVPQPIYFAPKTGGKPAVFAAEQMIPHSLVGDEKYVYWQTNNAILKQPKTGGATEIVLSLDDGASVDTMAQDATDLYFGLRTKGNSRFGLYKVKKAGGQPLVLVAKYSLKPVVVDAANVYFFDEETMNKDALCRVSINGGAVTRFDIGYESGAIDQSQTAVYFSGLDDIYEFSKP